MMPQVVMEQLGLEIIRRYKYMYSFYSRKVPCIIIIKDLVVQLVKRLRKHVMMDVVVENVPPTSRKWGASLEGNIQLDLYYATVPIF